MKNMKSFVLPLILASADFRSSELLISPTIRRGADSSHRSNPTPGLPGTPDSSRSKSSARNDNSREKYCECFDVIKSAACEAAFC